MKIYTASSWRNKKYRTVLDALEVTGHQVYDFQNDGSAFDWHDVDPSWDSQEDGLMVSVNDFMISLNHDLSIRAFNHDFGALEEADLLILVTPCGKSAHLEAGYAAGMGTPVWILLEDPMRPELTYKVADYMTANLSAIVDKLMSPQPLV